MFSISTMPAAVWNPPPWRPPPRARSSFAVHGAAPGVGGAVVVVVVEWAVEANPGEPVAVGAEAVQAARATAPHTITRRPARFHRMASGYPWIVRSPPLKAGSALPLGHMSLDLSEDLKQSSMTGSSRFRCRATSRWWGRQGSNLRPRDYESPALTTELLPREATAAARSADVTRSTVHRSARSSRARTTITSAAP